MSTSHTLNELLAHANAKRDAAQWPQAITAYRQLIELAPHAPELKHNLGLAYLAFGQPKEAIAHCSAALQANPQLWQSLIIRGKAHKELNLIPQAHADFQNALMFNQNNAEARLALADIALNEFGEPYTARDLVKPLHADPDYQMDAQLTTLMASLYDRPHWNAPAAAQELSDEIMTFSQEHLSLPELGLPALKARIGKYRPRVALLSPQFFMSPVYFLTITGWRKIAQECDIVIFNRGNKSDIATQEFKSLASEWVEVQHMSAVDLARQIHAADIDVLYDLGGWMDPIALKALSAKPARQQFKWVGGQSVTTGLSTFDGWIGDVAQSPKSLQSLYSEPLIQISGSYATYVPPSYLPKKHRHKSDTPCIFANPAKVSQPFLERLRTMPGKKVFIHRQYRHPQVKERILAGLGDLATAAEFIIPSSHEEALQAVNAHAVMIDTFPYNSGLTAREALAMGTAIQVLEVGSLFCERHTAHVA